MDAQAHDSVTWPIVAGPSKWDLMLALFHGTSQHRHLVGFSLGNQPGEGMVHVPLYKDIQVVITAVELEAGNGESWLLKGFLYSHGKGELTPSKHFTAYYCTLDRKGHLTYVAE